MKKVLLLGLVVLLVLSFGSLAFAKGSNPAINSAPAQFDGSLDSTTLDLSWTPLAVPANPYYSVTKYAVQVTVYSLSLDPITCPDTITVANFTVYPTGDCANGSVVVGGCKLNDIDLSAIAPAGYGVKSVSATVKGMITPVKKGSGYSSNNALSSWSSTVSECAE